MGIRCDYTVNWLEPFPIWFCEKYGINSRDTLQGWSDGELPFRVEDDLLRCMKEEIVKPIERTHVYNIQVDYTTDINEVYRYLITPSLRELRFQAVGWQSCASGPSEQIVKTPNVCEYDGGYEVY